MLTDLTCQEYKDGTVADALALGCDVFQVKMDGWWTHVAWRDAVIQLRSKTKRLYDTRPAPVDFWADIICESMVGTQRAQDPKYKSFLFMFDLWAINDQDLRTLPYIERMKKLARFFKVFNGPNQPFRAIPTYPIANFQAFWDKMVVPGTFEGAVFRKSTDVGTPCLVRQKLEITQDLIFVGIEEGEGRLAGSCGAIVGKTVDGVIVKVGGGMSDNLRTELFLNPMKYIGTWFEVTAKGRFESGSLRHPNFSRFRDDLS